MKKIFLSLLFSIIFTGFTNAECCPKPGCDALSKDCISTDSIKEDKACDKCNVDDDEYCVYNQCYFDKRYRLMKTRLSLTKQQETNIDCLYKKLKSDLEILNSRYRVHKNRVLEMIACSNKCYKEEARELKEYKKEIKDRMKCFKNDIIEQLCNDQRKKFRSFCFHEKRKLKRIVKYGAIYKFPCYNCNSK